MGGSREHRDGADRAGTVLLRSIIFSRHGLTPPCYGTTIARCQPEFKRELVKEFGDLRAALEEGLGPERLLSLIAGSRLSVWMRGDSDDGSIPRRAGIAVVAGEEMFDERVDFIVFGASDLDIFVEGEVTGAAGVSGGMECRDRFELDAVELFARLLV
jgi:hypothetical protein